MLFRSGGVFERQIGTIRKVLSGLLLKQSSSLTDECLVTLLHEVSAIINCRPLSHLNLSDSSIEPLTPYHLLTQKSRVIVAPPGSFVRQDLYLSERWRRVQYLANIFLESLASRVFGLYQQETKVDRNTTNCRCE